MRADPMPVARGYAPSRRGRSVAGGFALAASLGLLATLILMGRFDAPGGEKMGQLTAVNLSAQGEKDKPQERKQQQAAKAVTEAHAAPPPMMPPRVVVPAQQHYEMPPGFIHMTRQEFASSDIGQMKRADAGSAGAGAQGGGGSDDGAGEGPGGARVYNAEWYRKPRDAELAGYFQAGQRPGDWAMIVCRTVEQFHVEDCRELDESPRGSGSARALRRAAWQFLVRPPRINGKPQIGTWVRIRFDFTKGKSDSEPGGGEDAG
jgi:protein TonB